MAATIPAVSKEYLHGTVTASVALDTQGVHVAFLDKSAVPDDETAWIEAEWEGDVGKTRSWRLLIGPSTTAALTKNTYSVWVKVTDTDEVPVRKHDVLTIT